MKKLLIFLISLLTMSVNAQNNNQKSYNMKSKTLIAYFSASGTTEKSCKETC